MLWSADDANDDELTYSVYYRGENEKDWKLLQDKIDAEILFLGHHLHAGRRLLPENCRVG